MDEIRATLDSLNRAWREGRFGDLSQFFDENIVMKGPGLKDLSDGREALVQSYTDFMMKSKIVEYSESNHSIHQWGETGVASYDWSMSWEQNGKTDSATGQDMFVFQLHGSHWKAVLRVLLFAA